MRRVLWILLTPLLLVTGFYLLGKFYLFPLTESYIIEKIAEISEENSPLQIQVERIELFFLSPSIKFANVKFLPKTKDLKENLKEFRIQEIRGYFDFISLLSGDLHVSDLVFNGIHLQAKVQSQKNNDPFTEIPVDKIISILDKIPIRRFIFQKSNIRIETPEISSEFGTEKVMLVFEKESRKMASRLLLPDIEIQIRNGGTVRASLDTLLKYEDQKLKISKFDFELKCQPKMSNDCLIGPKGLNEGSGRISLDGEFYDLNMILVQPKGQITGQAEIPVGMLYEKLKPLLKKWHIPSILGSSEIKGEVEFKGFEKIKGEVILRTKDLKLDEFDLGNANLKGTFSENELSLSEIYLIHPAGRVKLVQSKLKLDRELNFSSKVIAEELDLQKLFLSLNLNKIPVDLLIAGELECRGQVFQEFLTTCSGDLSGKDLMVRSGMQKKSDTIVALDGAKVHGTTRIDLKSVHFEAEVNLQGSIGTTVGDVLYDKGFMIRYQSPKLNLQHIKNLADLNLRGEGSVEGFTEGDSDHGVFEMKINGKNFGIREFFLGDVLTQLSYRKEKLFFNDVVGKINSTEYSGNLSLDLDKSKVQGQFQMPTIDLGDVAIALDGLIHLPVSVGGSGTGVVSFNGPLNFWGLNYKLISKFQKGFVGPESFDELSADIVGERGRIIMTQVGLNKAQGSLAVTGEIGADQQMKLGLNGKNWKLEESDMMKKIHGHIVGDFDYDAKVLGTVTAPKFSLNGKVRNTVFEDQEMADSELNLNSSKNLFDGKVSFFGQKIEAQFRVPLDKAEGDLTFHSKISDLPFTQLLVLFGGSQLIAEYESSLNGAIDIKAPGGDLWRSSGSMRFDKVFLKRRAQVVSNPKPIEIIVNKGILEPENFVLSGNGHQIQIDALDDTENEEDSSAPGAPVANRLKIVADTDIRMWQLFVPFLEDLGGQMKLSTEVTFGKNQDLLLLGNAQFSDAFLKIRGVPHPFEKLQGDISFSNAKAFINNLEGFFAGGKVKSEGTISFEGIQNIPMQLKFNFADIHLNLPENVRTSGDAQLLFSGSWFPFVLSGAYMVKSGIVEKEFSENDGRGNSNIRQSVLLPKTIKEKLFEPLILDLQVQMDHGVSVKNSILDGRILGAVQVKGPPAEPIILGKIQLEKKSKVLFKDKIFEVQSGSVDFSNSNEMNPELYISALARVQEYDINLLVQGTSKVPNFFLTSIPPLPEKEIVSLLALGMTSTTLDTKVQSKDQAAQTGAEVGAVLLKQIKLDKKVQETTGWNLQVTSSVDSTKNISVPKAIAKRRVSDKVEASVSYASDQTKELKLQYFINNNLSTVGSYEERSLQESTGGKGLEGQSKSIFGLDLEYKLEFK